MTISLNVNGQEHMVDADPATPLLYVLREDLRLNAAKFGCGMGQCGSCTVMVDNSAVFSCLLPIAALAGRKVVTVEGLGSTEKPSAIQQAFIDEQAAQCGYCIAGMIMRAQSMLQKNSVRPMMRSVHTCNLIYAAAAHICVFFVRCGARPTP